MNGLSRALRRPRAAAVVTLAAVAAAACGTPPDALTTKTEAVRQATEPRHGDPTAATNPVVLPPAANKSAPAAPPSPSPSPKPAAPGPRPTRIGARHVLVQWMGTERAAAAVVRSRDQAFAVAKEVLRRARSGEDFARLAIEFSDEPGAGGRGGSLGRFGHGQMVPAFDEAAFALDVGEISDIVETSFGFHVIQRTE